jgi:phospholipase C
MRLICLAPLTAAAIVVAAGCQCGNVGPGDAGPSDSGTDGGPTLTGIHKIQHVIVIMQENRSFDHYFGTYPGVSGVLLADGGLSPVCLPSVGYGPLPDGGVEYYCALRDGGVSSRCIVQQDGGYCVPLHHDIHDVNVGGPHTLPDFLADVNDGGLDGFLRQVQKNGGTGAGAPCLPSDNGCGIDPMGYHDGRDIPNYWIYAQNFVLQDGMFEPNESWSNPEHQFLVSE